MGKNLMAEIPPGDFQATTPETPLLSQQAVTSKESQVPYQPIVEPLSQYATLKHQSEKIVGCKVLQFIHTIKIRKMLGPKTLRCKYIATSPRKR